MKLNTTTLVLGVALTVVAGLFSSNIFGMTGVSNDAQTSAAAKELITGHVVTTVTDSNGNVKEYRQSDNIVVQNGENCAVARLFGVFTGGCSSSNAAFNVIAIGNGTTVVVPRNSTSLSFNWPANGGTPAEQNAVGLTRASATTVTPTAASSSVFASTVISKTFTNSATTTQTVTQSGLFNSTTIAGSGMFARQHFTSISMNPSDSLTVQWTINIGGQSSLSTPGPS